MGIRSSEVELDFKLNRPFVLSATASRQAQRKREQLRLQGAR